MARTGSYVGNPETQTVTIDSDLSAKDNHAVTWDATDEDVVNLTANASKFPYVLLDGYDGSTTAQTGTIALSGVCLVKTGGVVAPGDKLTATTAGVWIVTTTDTDHYGAVALEVGASGDLVKARVERGMVAG